MSFDISAIVAVFVLGLVLGVYLNASLGKGTTVDEQHLRTLARLEFDKFYNLCQPAMKKIAYDVYEERSRGIKRTGLVLPNG